MSYTQPIFEPRPIPPKLQTAHTFQDLREGTKQFASQFLQDSAQYITQFAANHNKNAQGFGSDVVSAPIIQVDGTLQQIVTGTAAIATITPPAKFNGFKALYSRDGFSLVTGGNIATAFTATVGTLVLLLYFPPTGLWGIISTPFVGVLPANSVGPTQLQANAVTSTAIAAAAVTTPKLGVNAVTYPASNLFSGALVIDGAANPFDSWIDVPNTSISISIFAQTDPVYMQDQRDLTYANLAPGDIIQNRVIDDLGVVYVNPLNNVTAQAGLAASGVFNGLASVENIAPAAGAYPLTRTYHEQVQVHSAGAPHALSVTFNRVKIWGWDSRA